MAEGCSICNGKADEEFKRIEVWSNGKWRLTMSTYEAVKGLCYLEPRRHIPYITDLQDPEASDFGLEFFKNDSGYLVSEDLDSIGWTNPKDDHRVI